MADKVTKMELKVDLQCPRCYRKIKKVLCKYPEIRDQTFDEKQNKVKITVVTCCPEVILKRISSKGGRSVESIVIVPDKKEPEKKEGDKDKPKETGDKKKDAGGAKPKDAAEKKKDAGGEKGKETPEKKKDPSAENKPDAKVHKDVFEPIAGFPMIYPSGVPYNNQPYYPGYGGGIPMPMPMPMPCYHELGRPCICYGMPVYEGYVGNRGGYSNPGHFDYFSEENPESCSIM